MRVLKPLIMGLCIGSSAAAVASPVNILAAERAEASWVIVPDFELAKLHGGFDLNPGNLVAYFAIARTVEVNGQVVAQMQLVITNLGNLASGGLPQISVTGPLAQLIQVLDSGQGASAGGAAGLLMSTPVATPAATSSATAAAAPVSTALPVQTAPISAPAVATVPAVTSSAPGVTSGSVSSPDVQSGSTSQFGSALTNAVAVANGALSGTGSAPAPSAPTPSVLAPTGQPAVATSTPVATQVHPSVQASPLVAATPAAPSAPATAAPIAAASPQVTSAPTAGGVVPVIVISNLPNATAITTAVQNDVLATTIQTQTTITATLGSLPVVNALSLASAIQAQVAASISH